MTEQSTKRRRVFDTVRSRLTLVILLAMLPVLMFSLANAVREYIERKETAERELVRSAELVTKEVGAVFASALQVLMVSRNLAVVRDSQPPACTDYLRGTLAGQDMFANIATIAANGDVLCSALAAAEERNFAGAAWFTRFQRVKAFSVGAVLTGSITGQPVLTASLPPRRAGRARSRSLACPDRRR